MRDLDPFHWFFVSFLLKPSEVEIPLSLLYVHFHNSLMPFQGQLFPVWRVSRGSLSFCQVWMGSKGEGPNFWRIKGQISNSEHKINIKLQRSFKRKGKGSLRDPNYVFLGGSRGNLLPKYFLWLYFKTKRLRLPKY